MWQFYFCHRDLSNSQRICASLKVTCRAWELSWTCKYRKGFFMRGGGVGKGRANSFLSCRYPPTFVRPKQEQWAAVLPLPSPHPFPDSRGPDHLGDVETL